MMPAISSATQLRVGPHHHVVLESPRTFVCFLEPSPVLETVQEAADWAWAAGARPVLVGSGARPRRISCGMSVVYDGAWGLQARAEREDGLVEHWQDLARAFVDHMADEWPSWRLQPKSDVVFCWLRNREVSGGEGA